MSGVAIGVVHASGCRVGPAPPELVAALDRAIRLYQAGSGAAAEPSSAAAWPVAVPGSASPAGGEARHGGEAGRGGDPTPGGEAVVAAVRKLLRHGRYQPSGRSKPASEYLQREAREGRLPRVNNLVDLNTLVSLRSGLPASILDLSRAGTRAFTVRRGRAGEAYTFNAAGQDIGLEDLLLVATLPDDRPCANPVKDSMATKVTPDTTEVLAIVYAPASLREALDEAVFTFSAGLRAWVGATVIAEHVVTG